MIDPLRAIAIDCAMTAQPLGGGTQDARAILVQAAYTTVIERTEHIFKLGIKLSDTSRFSQTRP
ncbi:hypothetical protein [Xanthomonas campestris]|uniref:hypothetical protein n=1 Tax=Xanthomonas campestris TaxID=339 RepID=UPI0036DEEEEE